MTNCEIIRTCSHDKVAEAAVLSIGSAFRDRVALVSSAAGQPMGVYVAGLVRSFREEATDRDLSALSRATAGSDMPILDGLRFIVEFMIDGTAGGRVPRSRRGAGARRSERCAQAA